MFRLLSLKVFEDCAACAHKVLQAGASYMFCEDYAEYKDNTYTLTKIGEVTDMCRHLYDCHYQVEKDGMAENRTIAVSIHAIVGKNGDGKSSVVEMIIRIINNFAICCGYRTDHKSLMYNVSVSGALFYEMNNDVFCIWCPMSKEPFDTDGRAVVQLYKNGELISGELNGAMADAERKNWMKEHCLDGLFYTMVNNYSIYSYNSNQFRKESPGPVCWIDSLFHKNDAYQTPVVINPMRSQGVININKEASLSRQRLMSLYTMCASDINQMKIGENKEVLGFAFNVEKESKLITKTIAEYMGEHRHDDFALGNLEELYHQCQNSSQGDEGLMNVCDHFIRFFKSFIQLWNEAPLLADIIRNIMSNDVFERRADSDFGKYISIVIDCIRNKTGEYDEVRNALCIFRDKSLKNLNYAQFYRIAMVLQTWKLLRELLPGEFNISLNKALEHRSQPKVSALLYICYKMVEIVYTYSPYNLRAYTSDACVNMISNPIDIWFSNYRIDMKEILTIDDYTTLKLRQCLNYIKFHKEEYFAAKRNEINPNMWFVDFKSLHDVICSTKSFDGMGSVITLLPPPIFVGDILVKVDDGEVPFCELSSGELQMQNTIGAFLYHLRNLDDEQKHDGKIQYKNVVCIFEEVELYFHPEYQRKFISALCGQIQHSNLLHIEGIDLVFVTHSPFLLTDVLKSNTLYLEKGIQKQVDMESFGANLFDLMHESFFLHDNAMGEFASNFIKHLIGERNRGKVIPDEKSDIIGDSLLRNYLKG